MKVFLSSVIGGMEACRDAAARAIRALGHEAIQAENFKAQSESPREVCLAEVRQADVFVLLMGARYGEPQSHGLSATHEEYREAREHCHVIVMVQDGVQREPKQNDFLREVQDWTQGHYTGSFDTPDCLRDKVTGNLHKLSIRDATNTFSSDEILQRTISLLPSEDHRYITKPRLAIALAGSPVQTLLRPAKLEERNFCERLEQIALFGRSAVLKRGIGTNTYVDVDKLVFEQSERFLSISEKGSILYISEIRGLDTVFPVIIEEEVAAIISQFLEFAKVVLDDIDSISRLNYVALAAKFLGARHMGWQTEEEQKRRPNQVSISLMGEISSEPCFLSPPHIARSSLRMKTNEVTEDLTALLRRQRKKSRDTQWL